MGPILCEDGRRVEPGNNESAQCETGPRGNAMPHSRLLAPMKDSNHVASDAARDSLKDGPESRRAPLRGAGRLSPPELKDVPFS